MNTKARDFTREYSSSDELHLSDRSAKRKAVVVGGLATEFASKTLQVQAAKIPDEMGPTRRNAIKSTWGSVVDRLSVR